MIDTGTWMPAAVEALKQAFGQRLRFVGLQGSYRRGEATEASDIDLCVILNWVAPKDLEILREVLNGLPEGHKAAGFVCGARELLAWPRFELFAFQQDMDAWYSKLAPLLPHFTREDTLLGCRTAIAALYHEAGQALLLASGLSPEAAAAARHSLFKTSLRALQYAMYLRKGCFPRDRATTLGMAEAYEREAKLVGTLETGCSLTDLATACFYWSRDELAELPVQA
ncbi:MAG: nucleotidyltransferase domain-containing protein [Desulfovibrio sp.]|nr:nucleotidyltransferase domain-containing protein [Desulfovibrio sp.]